MKREMEAYIVLLHLVSQGWASFKDISCLVGWDVWRKSEAQRIIAHINQKILALSKAWDEDIPRINVFVLNRFGEWTSYVCEESFEGDAEEHPLPARNCGTRPKSCGLRELGQGLRSISGGSFFEGGLESDRG